MALMSVMVALAILSVMLTAITWTILANRQMLQRRETRLQALWLARAGVEIACENLMRNPAYTGETSSPSAQGEVKISVTTDPKTPGVFHISSQARFPLDRPDLVVREVSASLRRRIDGDDVRLEFLPSD